DHRAVPVDDHAVAVGLRPADVAGSEVVQRVVRRLLRGEHALHGLRAAVAAQRPHELARDGVDPGDGGAGRGQAAVRDLDHVDVLLLVAIPRDLVRQRAGRDALLRATALRAAVADAGLGHLRGGLADPVRLSAQAVDRTSAGATHAARGG